MLRGKIFEINEEIEIGGLICPPPSARNRVKDQVISNGYDNKSLGFCKFI